MTNLQRAIVVSASLVVILATIGIAWAVSLLGIEYQRCDRVQLNSAQMGTFYYWQWVHKSNTHGICASMYEGREANGTGNGLWEVEIPAPGEPTAEYVFDSRADAENWAESHCWTRVKEWKVETVASQ